LDMRRFITIWISFLLSGCVTIGGALFSMPEQAPPGYATLVIYREKGLTGAASDHGYYVNDTLVALLGTHTYTHISIKEGRTSVRWGVGKGDKGTSRPFEITAVAGETYFYKEGARLTGFIPLPPPWPSQAMAKTTFGLMEPSAAKQELSTYRYVEPIVPSL
jgi:hypothetical protein